MAIAIKDGEDVTSIGNNALVRRLYKVVKFRGDDGRITFRHHIEARAAKDLEVYLAEIGKSKKGASTISTDIPELLLLLGPSVYLKRMLFEGIHFKMMLDGTIIPL